MATILNLLFAVLFLSLIGQGHCECTLDSVTISQTQTGKTVENLPEWKVTISNSCECSQSEVTLSCNGFQTVETIDSSVLAKTGGLCLINNGEAFPPFSEFSFNYAWKTSFPFRTYHWLTSCSESKY